MDKNIIWMGWYLLSYIYKRAVSLCSLDYHLITYTHPHKFNQFNCVENMGIVVQKQHNHKKNGIAKKMGKTIRVE